MCKKYGHRKLTEFEKKCRSIHTIQYLKRKQIETVVVDDDTLHLKGHEIEIHLNPSSYLWKIPNYDNVGELEGAGVGFAKRIIRASVKNHDGKNVGSFMRSVLEGTARQRIEKGREQYMREQPFVTERISEFQDQLRMQVLARQQG